MRFARPSPRLSHQHRLVRGRARGRLATGVAIARGQRPQGDRGRGEHGEQEDDERQDARVHGGAGRAGGGRAPARGGVGVVRGAKGTRRDTPARGLRRAPLTPGLHAPPPKHVGKSAAAGGAPLTAPGRRTRPL